MNLRGLGGGGLCESGGEVLGLTLLAVLFEHNHCQRYCLGACYAAYGVCVAWDRVVGVVVLGSQVERTSHLANLKSISPLRSAANLLSSLSERRTTRAATAR